MNFQPCAVGLAHNGVSRLFCPVFIHPDVSDVLYHGRVHRTPPLPANLLAALLIIIAIIGGGTTTAIHAQTAEPTALADSQIYLHIPSKMIAGHTYQGVAVSAEPAGLWGADRTVYLSTGSPSVDLPYSTIEIAPGRNHAVFEITAVRSGEAQIDAAYGGLVGRATGQVYAQSSGPHSLDIVLPGERTSATHLAALVYLQDVNGYPVPAPAGGISIRLVGGGLVKAPHTVHIAQGETSVPIPLRISGTGYLTAASPGLQSDRADIAYDTDDIRVRLQVAPDIVLPGGLVHYAVWLERANSNSDTPDTITAATTIDTSLSSSSSSSDSTSWSPYHPPRTIPAELQTTNPDIVRLTESFPSNKKQGASEPIKLYGGRATGVIFAGYTGTVSNPTIPSATSVTLSEQADADSDGGGIAVLTVSVPGYGVATAHVCVGTIVTETTQTTIANATTGDVIETSADTAQTAAGDGTDNNTAGSDTNTGADTGDEYTGDSQNGPRCGAGTESFSEYVKRLVLESVAERVGASSSFDTDTAPLTLPRELPENPEANDIKFFVQPNLVTPLPDHSEAYGVVGFYHTETEERADISLSYDGSVLFESESSYERITPVRVDYERVTVTVSSAPGSERRGFADGGGLDVQPYHVAHPTFHTNSMIFPIGAGAEGAYELSAVAGGHSKNTTLRVVHPYETGYHLQIVELPVLPVQAAEDEGADESDSVTVPLQPLFLVTLTDDMGRIIDITEEFGGPRTIRIMFDDASSAEILALGASPSETASGANIITPNTIIDHGQGPIFRDLELSEYNTAIIYGAITDGKHISPDAVITLEGWPPASAPSSHTVTPAGTPVSMEMDVPQTVHAGEPFPITTHTVDALGIPVELISASERRDSGFSQAPDRSNSGVVNEPGPTLLSSIYDVGGAVQAQVTSFLNEMQLTVRLDDQPVPVPVGADTDDGLTDGLVILPADTKRHLVEAGRPFELDVKATAKRSTALHTDTDANTSAARGTTIIVPGATYNVEVPPGWPPAEQPEPGVFVIHPQTEGDHTLLVTTMMDGFTTRQAAVPVRASMSVPVMIDGILLRTGATTTTAAAADGDDDGNVPLNVSAIISADTVGGSAAVVMSDLAVRFDLTGNQSAHQTPYNFVLNRPGTL